MAEDLKKKIKEENLGAPEVKISETDVSDRPDDGGLTGAELIKLMSAKHKKDEEYAKTQPKYNGGKLPPYIKPDEDDHGFNADFSRDFGI